MSSVSEGGCGQSEEKPWKIGLDPVYAEARFGLERSINDHSI